ncbi:hypothetical protein EVAR_82408_1 [Eumeta japonica]|uniref:Uncharacterized protein n=1 Tax=Eumeta variegata TaxID=151549 RepID=A0A4C1U9X3_EUMVA|nr:hypothetical protein EVAR_82408_1 [Eumeta japonica]
MLLRGRPLVLPTRLSTNIDAAYAPNQSSRISPHVPLFEFSFTSPPRAITTRGSSPAPTNPDEHGRTLS